MKIGIVTDSTADLPAALVEEFRIHVVPSILILDGREYADGIGITREEFYTKLPSFRTPPTTAAPSIGDFIAPYQKLLAQGCDHVLSIHAASQLTTIVNIARQAADEFPGKVTCMDSGSLSLGLGFQVIAAAEEAEMGLETMLAAATAARQRLKVYAALDTMEYLKRSGRVPGAIAGLGNYLSIKPIVELKGGEVKPISAVRTTGQADERMLELLMETGPLQRLAILHTNAEPRARQLLDELMQQARMSVPRDILFVNVTTVIGTHVGPNGLGFASVGK